MTTPAKTAGGTETGEDSGYKTLLKAPKKHHTRPSRPNQRGDKIRTGHYYDFIQRNIQNIAVMVILSSFCFGLFIGKLANKETRNMSSEASKVELDGDGLGEGHLKVRDEASKVELDGDGLGE